MLVQQKAWNLVSSFDLMTIMKACRSLLCEIWCENGGVSTSDKFFLRPWCFYKIRRHGKHRRMSYKWWYKGCQKTEPSSIYDTVLLILCNRNRVLLMFKNCFLSVKKHITSLILEWPAERSWRSTEITCMGAQLNYTRNAYWFFLDSVCISGNFQHVLCFILYSFQVGECILWFSSKLLSSWGSKR